MEIENYSNLKKFKDFKNKNQDCNVSKASNEIMLNRISEGEELEFPFNKTIHIS